MSGLKCGPAYIPTSTSPTCPDHERQSMSSDTSLPELGDQERASKLVEACQKIRDQVSKIVVGQDQVVEELLMPADITGTDIIQEKRVTGHRDLVFDKGPIFTQMLLADEINRTPPKTQAALLEAMQEHEVTVGGTTYRLDEPFFVLATQNPIEQEGTYPLPEAQRDRFLFNVIVDYPSREQESEIIDRTTSTRTEKLAAVVTGDEIIECQNTVRMVPLPDHVKNYVLDLVRSARPKAPTTAAWVRDLIDWGPGPRACQQLVLAAKARALMQGRFHVTLKDVEALSQPVLRHRIVPTFNAEAEGIAVEEIVQRLLDAMPKSVTQSL